MKNRIDTAINNPQKGAILIMTLVFLSLLSMNAFYFSYFMRTRLDLWSNQISFYKTECLAKTGTDIGKGILDSDDNPYTSLNDIWNNTHVLNLPEGTVTINIYDLNSRINVNGLIDDQGNTNTALISLFRNLLTFLGASPDLTDVLLDWLDSDDFPRVFGAESDYYQTLSPPYVARNGPIPSLKQFRLMKDFAPELLDGSGSDTQPGLLDLVTNISDSKINPNTADPLILKSMGYSDESISNILNERSQGPVDVSSLMNLDSVTTLAWKGSLTTKSTYFKIVSTAETGRIKKTMSLIVKKSAGKTVDLQWEQ